MGDGRDFDELLGQINAVRRQPVDDGAEGAAQFCVRHMLEAEIGAARRRAATGLHFLGNGVGGAVAGQHIFAIAAGVAGGVILFEFLQLAIQQLAAELVAEWVPHDGVHAHEARRQMADGEELHELHVDQLSARAQGQRIAIAAHIEGGAVATIKPREPACRDDHGFRGQRHGLAGGQMHRDGAAGPPIAHDDVDDGEIADAANAAGEVQLRAQGARHGGAGGEHIHIDAARTVMARRMDLRDMIALARPAHFPRVHLADARGAVLAEHSREALVAQASPCCEGVGEVIFPGIGRLFAKGDRHGHLRHDGGAATADEAAVGEDHGGAGACGFKRGIHACAACANHQNVGFKMHLCLPPAQSRRLLASVR